MNKKKALVLGVSGQDGAYLAQFLLDKGYHIVGSSRDSQAGQFNNLKKLGIDQDVQVESLSLLDFRSIVDLIRSEQPDEIYNLAGQTSVGLSFDQPIETLESVALGTLTLLEAIRLSDLPIRFYNAGSGEVFGDTLGIPATEQSVFKPRSPYGIAKASAFWYVVNYRDSYQMHSSTGILFNHESPLRPVRFVTQKIIRGAIQCARDKKTRLRLGNIDIFRDWGWAPEYVQAMWRMLQLEKPEDFVIATGRTVSLEFFIDCAFKHCGLDWREWVDIDSGLTRPSDIKSGQANPEKAGRLLGWKAQTSVEQVISLMIAAAVEDWEAK